MCQPPPRGRMFCRDVIWVLPLYQGYSGETRGEWNIGIVQIHSPGYALDTHQTLVNTQRLREKEQSCRDRNTHTKSNRVGIAILNTGIQISPDTQCFKDRDKYWIQNPRDIPCFSRKNRASTGFMFCALHRALERIGQILDDCYIQILAWYRNSYSVR